MGWTDELYQIYEFNCGRDFAENEPVMLPVSHSTANSQIELTLDKDGNFITARPVDKTECVTIIPVTEDSGSRTSGVVPMPFADKLVYLAGDYDKYAKGKIDDNSKYFNAYLKQLKTWQESDFSHPAVQVVYTYLAQRKLLTDLIGCGVLRIDADTGKLQEKVKLAGIAQEDCFVRFVVHYPDFMHETRTWKDQTLYDSFIRFNSSTAGECRLCYATGKELPTTYKHPSKIRNSGDKAKLISSNDERSGFSYRGRFHSKEEALSVSYDFSQKMHNALKWLIQKQGMTLDTMTLLVWASALRPVPDVREDCINSFCEDDSGDELQIPDTMAGFQTVLKNRIFGYKKNFQPDTKVMLMGLDAATTGRLSISMFSELPGSDFMDAVECWHTQTAWLRRDKRKTEDGKPRNVINSFSLYEIAKCSFGTEQNERLECKKEVMKETVLRLLPCVTGGRRLPKDIVNNLFHKASNPLSFEKEYNHRIVLETACGMIRKQYIDDKKGDISMSYDPNQRDRSYLYGCLLAIADKAESDTFDAGDKGKRVTNARRFWNAFSSRPCQTWKVIEERLRPYLEKNEYNISVEKKINEIMDKMDTADYSDNSALSPLYLLGYHHYTSFLYTKKED